jgi:ABC-2 type transport system permease protein
MILTIAMRELRSLFVSPVAWATLAVVQVIGAFLFLAQVEFYAGQVMTISAGQRISAGITDLVIAPLFNNMAIVMLLVVPLLGMRLFSEERRSGTISLLLSSPLSMATVVLGKYVGLLLFLLFMLLLIVLMPLSLLAGGTLDGGKLAAGVLGLTLLLAAFSAAALYLSTITAQPAVAAISSFGLLLLFWVIDWVSMVDEQFGGLFAYLSLFRHLEGSLTGLVASTDLVYYLLFSATFLILAIHHLERSRVDG